MFYKNEENVLVKANFIDGPGYSLSVAGQKNYIYPVAGWHWFDTNVPAILTLGVTWPENPDSPIGKLKIQAKEIEKQIAALTNEAVEIEKLKA